MIDKQVGVGNLQLFKIIGGIQIMNKEIETKRCNKCGRELSISEFSKHNKTKDGLQGWCKECHNKYNQTDKQKEYQKEYQRQYQQTHKQYRNQINNRFRNQFTGCYLYIILDKQDNIVYVGQTSNYYNRLYNHLSGSVNSTQELFASNDWSKIKYLDVSDIVENEMELRALENELIELYEPKLNKAKNIIHDIERGRLFSLLAQLHSILNEWIVFRTNV